MAKIKSKSIAVMQAAGLAARALARLESTARAVHANETEKRDRELQLVSTAEHGFSAVIRHGKTIVEISGDSFAVRQTGG
jgi:hypothetical protein